MQPERPVVSDNLWETVAGRDDVPLIRAPLKRRIYPECPRCGGPKSEAAELCHPCRAATRQRRVPTEQVATRRPSLQRELLTSVDQAGALHAIYPTGLRTLCLRERTAKHTSAALPTCGVCIEIARAFDRIDGSAPPEWRRAA